jgi:hypothetical protein
MKLGKYEITNIDLAVSEVHCHHYISLEPMNFIIYESSIKRYID